ncbi:MAG: Asp-tRNA(Asn)/Glu-tRNA(Gln) amidotransferase subunit GatA [Candidatus Eremiobacteraeota bacterium]|nr:Asp-tRNA(Asn)/Glu-tRNA(Gln) amidotransferase subunit GatA [Candidatus Eremiobacteraeota bacterium]
MELHEFTAGDIRKLLRERKISSVELTRAYLERISALDDRLKAFITVTKDMALEMAAAADKAFGEGRESTVGGIPLALKDNLSVKGIPCTCGSSILQNYVAPYNATVVERLVSENSVIMGKTNMDEFAMGSSTENSAFFTTGNPWDLSRVPGGSSGGSAAAVAARMVPWALGSDTGGSVRQPAAFCGITGLKPTYGLISRYGLVAYASSLDQIGILSRNTEDCALLLKAIAGQDRRDSTSAGIPVPDYEAALRGKEGNFTIGIVEEFFQQSLDDGIRTLIEQAAHVFEGMGWSLKRVSFPHIRYSLASYYIIAPAEASSNLARYDGSRYGLREPAETTISMFKRSREKGFGAEVKRRIMMGTYTLSAGYYDAYYLKAQKVRTLIKRDFDEAFRECSFILAPVTPTAPFRKGENIDDPLKMYLSDIYTVSVNLAGLPGLVLPCGFSGGLPVALQLIGKPFDEVTLLRAGTAFQRATDFHLKNPPLGEAVPGGSIKESMK